MKQETQVSTTTKQNYLERYNPSSNFVQVASFHETWSNQSKALVVVFKEVGKDAVMSLIKLYMIQVNELINVQTKMSPVQIEYFAPMLYEKFKLLKPQDLALWVKMFVSGDLGKIYNRLDGTMMLEFADKYIDLRLDAAHEDNQREAQKHIVTHERTSGDTKIIQLLKLAKNIENDQKIQQEKDKRK